MNVNVAVLKETRPHERRVALTPSVIPKLIKLQMRSGAGEGGYARALTAEEKARIDKALTQIGGVTIVAPPQTRPR